MAFDTSSAAVTAALVEVGGGPGPDLVLPEQTMSPETMPAETMPAETMPAETMPDRSGSHVLAQHLTVNARGHGEYLTPLLAACLADGGVAASDLGAVVVGTGPGPYTGLRVGLVTAAVLAETLGIPAYGVCSLDGIAGVYGPQAGALLVASDARRKEVYWAQYRDGERTAGPAVSRPSDVPIEGVRAMTGAGARVYRDLIALPLLETDYPQPQALVRCALDRLRGTAPSDPLTPLYLRRPDAVVPGLPKPVTQ